MARLLTRVLPAAACLSLAVVSLIVWRADARARRPVDQFIKDFRFDIRRPDVAKSVDLAPSSDIGADLLAHYALADAVVPAKLRDMTPEERQAWIEMPASIGRELRAARELMLSSIARRPGWPYHQALLGQVVYADGARTLSSDLVRHSQRWSLPLQHAATRAPADGQIWQTLALSYLQTWPDLSDKYRDKAPETLRRAFEDPAFVRVVFGPAVDMFGLDESVAALPDRPVSLKHAFETLRDRGQLEAAWNVHQRWETTEWLAREKDLLEIESRVRRGDDVRARRLCERWASAHSVWDWDSREGQAQAARLLELWPAGADGTWNRDPRGEIVRYFLAGRHDGAPGAGLVRAVDSLEGVPGTTLAEALATAGEISRAEALDRELANESYLERVPYLVTLARKALTHEGPERATAILRSIPPVAEGECAVQAIRQEIEAAASGASRPAATEPRRLLIEAGSDEVVCSQSRQSFSVGVRSERPMIVDLLRNHARIATLFTSEGATSWIRAVPAPGVQLLSVRSNVSDAARRAGRIR